MKFVTGLEVLLQKAQVSLSHLMDEGGFVIPAICTVRHSESALVCISMRLTLCKPVATALRWLVD